MLNTIIILLQKRKRRRLRLVENLPTPDLEPTFTCGSLSRNFFFSLRPTGTTSTGSTDKREFSRLWTQSRWLHFGENERYFFNILEKKNNFLTFNFLQNRPAMNYDKLSRSLRQYYKKGIMKKTERSQRLVYQFCHPYHL